MRKSLLFFSLLLPFVPLIAQHPCYIGAPSGLNIRSGPSLDSEVVARLPYGRWVQVLDTTEYELTLRDEGRLITGHWLKVSFPPYLEADRSEDIEGYAFGPFLTQEIERIPPHTLLYAWEVWRLRPLGDQTAEYRYEINWTPPYSSHRQARTRLLPAYFDPLLTAPTLVTTPYRDRQEQEISPEALYDTIQSYLQFELISDARAAQLRSRSIRNPYAIDPTPRQRDLKPDSWQGDFLLPIASGEDSIRITDYDGEGYINKRFVGTLHKLGQYVVNESYEEPSHVFYDEETGERKQFSMGYPLISPDGKCVLDLYPAFMEYGCILHLRSLDAALEPLETLRIHFRTWVPRVVPGSFFWLSDRELCVQVAPASQTETSRSMRDILGPLPPEDHQWMYVRIK